jgi:acyl carrier protein
MTTHDDLWRRLGRVLGQVFGDEVETQALNPETTAADIPGWDSVRHVELMVAVEAEFAIRFRTGEIANVPDLGSLVELIARRLPART